MSTHNVVSVESPMNVTADTNDAGKKASAERPESGPSVVRVSLFGFLIEMAENTGVMPVAILGC